MFNGELTPHGQVSLQPMHRRLRAPQMMGCGAAVAPRIAGGSYLEQNWVPSG